MLEIISIFELWQILYYGCMVEVCTSHMHMCMCDVYFTNTYTSLLNFFKKTKKANKQKELKKVKSRKKAK